jgi:hypothetical protein
MVAGLIGVWAGCESEEECPTGSLGCPCWADQACGLGLVCDGTCVDLFEEPIGPPDPDQPTNLVPNGSFTTWELGSPVDWILDADAWNRTLEEPGGLGNAIRITSTEPGSLEQRSLPFISSPWVGDTLELTFAARHVSGDTSPVTATLSFEHSSDGDPSDEVHTVALPPFSTSGEWVTRSFIVPIETEEVLRFDLVLEIARTGQTQTVDLDDVAVFADWE